MISDEQIDYPKVLSPDILVIMSQEAYTTYGKSLKEGGMLIIDEDMVTVPEGVPFLGIPSTRLAEQMGKKIVANIVMLGFFASKVDIVPSGAVKKSLLENVPKRTEELNTKAFDTGFGHGKKIP